jgi:aminoglycoside phosphotransferase (APT) family kinase protein
VGLADFGRPAGYLERQLRRWWQQFESSRSRPLEGIEELRDRLAATVPASPRASIVHGDFRLDNTIVDPPRIRAVLDWEMATLGDPLTDLGMLGVYWDLAGSAAGNPITTAVAPGRGFATMDELAARYADRSGLDLTTMPWYRAFSRFKLAVILEGIHYRHLEGRTVGEGFAGIGGLVAPIVRGGLDEL